MRVYANPSQTIRTIENLLDSNDPNLVKIKEKLKQLEESIDFQLYKNRVFDNYFEQLNHLDELKKRCLNLD